MPAHPRHLLPAVRQILPLVGTAVKGEKFPGGIYSIPDLYPFLQKENKVYKDSLPRPWQKYTSLPSIDEIKTRWRQTLKRK